MGINGTITALRAERGSEPSGYADVMRDSASDPEKLRCRDIFARFVADNHPPTQGRGITFPGVRWGFEWQMLDILGDCEFVGIERDPRVFRMSIPWMADRKVRRSIVQSVKVESGYEFSYAQRGHAKLLNLSASDFFRVRRSNILSHGERRDWTAKFRLATFAWLDFVSPICPESEICMTELGGSLNPSFLDVPVAITVLKGRETPDQSRRMEILGKDRVGFITHLLNCSGADRVFTVADTIEYTSSAGSPMLMVFGLLTGALGRVCGNPRPISI